MGFLHNLYSTIELGDFSLPFLGHNSHPVHPTLVHFPVAFLTSAYTLDTIFGLTSHYSKSIHLTTRLVPYLPQIATLAYASHVVAVTTSVPALTSGTAEWWELYKSDGINAKDKKLTNPGLSGDELIKKSINIGAVHGLLNGVAFGVSTYAAISRYRTPGSGFVPGRVGIWLSALALPGVMLSAALGGELVYGKGVGVQRMGYARDEKLAGVEERKELAKKEL